MSVPRTRTLTNETHQLESRQRAFSEKRQAIAMRNRVQKDLDDELASGVAAEAFENIAVEVGLASRCMLISTAY